MKPFSRMAFAVLCSLALVVGLAACGDDESSPKSSSTPTTTQDANPAAAATKAALAPVTEVGDPATTSKPAAGKHVVVVTCALLSTCKSGADGIVEAGKVLGWKVDVIDGKYDPAVWNQAVASAAAPGTDAIVLAGVAGPIVANALKKAVAAKVPVVSIFQPPNLPGTPPGSIYGSVSPQFQQDGATMANWIAADSGGEASVLHFVDPSFPEVKLRDDAFDKQLAKTCPGCTEENVKFSALTAPQSLPQRVVSALQTHPDATYVVAPVDNLALFVAQGIRQAGKADKVKLVAWQGDPDGIQRIQQGAQSADVAFSGNWAGWQTVDLLNRAFAGEPPLDLEIASRLVDETNVGDLEVTDDGWQGDVDFRSHYKELWGK